MAKKYETWTLERHVLAPRDLTWQVLLAFVSNKTERYDPPGEPDPHGPGATLRFSFDGYDLIERVITLEPPWRRVYEIVDGAPLEFYQGTTTIRDDGPAECHVAWCAVYDPLPDGASGDFPDRSRDVVAKVLEEIGRRAEARAAAE